MPLVLSGGRVEAVGPYHVRGVLGRGGMGVVYEVEHQGSGRRFALKTIEARFLDLPDSNAGRRFSNEITLLARLDHPSIVRLHDYGFARHPLGYDLAFFVMDRLRGSTIGERMESGERFSLREILGIARDVTAALGHLDAHQVLHRDIKPANLFLTDDGRVVLMDFGLARSKDLTRLTRTGHVIGTLPYMSPEALRGKELTVASDVYALGVVCFEGLLGDLPFHAKDATQMVAEIGQGVRWPAEPRLDAPPGPEVRALIGAMLAATPAARPSPDEVERRASALLGPPAAAPVAALISAEATVAPQPQAATLSLVFEPLDIEATRGPKMAPEPLPSLARPRPERPSPARPSPARQPEARLDEARIDSGYVERVLSRGASPGLWLHPRGPTWLTAAGSLVVSAALAFAAGLMLGRVSPAPSVPAPERRIEVLPAVVLDGTEALDEASTEELARAEERRGEAEEPTFTQAAAAYRYGDLALTEGRYPSAIRALEQALALNPAYAVAYRRLGDAHLAQSDVTRALEHYKTYLALRPTAPDAARVKKLIEGL